MDERALVLPRRSGSLAEQELSGSLAWLIRLRWLAGVGVLLGTVLVGPVSKLRVPEEALYLLGAGLLVYNAVLWAVLRWLDARPTSGGAYQWFARAQIGLDWLATALLVHLTGGISSPALFFFLFHIVVAAMLLPHDRGFVYVALAPLLVGGIAFLQNQGIIEHYPLYDGDRFGAISYLHDVYDDLFYVAGVWLFFTAACYAIAYLSMNLSQRLRRMQRQLAGAYQRIDTLYKVTTTVSSTLDLESVLNLIARNAAQEMGVKACTIRLLDESGEMVDTVASYGIDKQFLSPGPIDLQKSLITYQTLSGQLAIVADVTQDERFQYAAEVVSEGLQSMLCVPLLIQKKAEGVICVYDEALNRFSKDDAEFLSALGSAGATAIENARVYQALETADRAKTEFVRTVTHELRSPVNVASSLLKLLDRGYVGELNDKQADLVGRSRRRIEFLQALVDDLLDLAAGRSEVMKAAEQGPVELGEVAAEVVVRFEARAEEKGLALRLERPTESLTVTGNAEELDRILNNLVSNAVKYTQEGEVAVRLERANGLARMVISDTGIGIPADALPDLFREFFRARNAKAVDESGTGLGLSIVKNLVERYGGDIEVVSEEGRGTTFTVTLPLSEAPAKT